MQFTMNVIQNILMCTHTLLGEQEKKIILRLLPCYVISLYINLKVAIPIEHPYTMVLAHIEPEIAMVP